MQESEPLYSMAAEKRKGDLHMKYIGMYAFALSMQECPDVERLTGIPILGTWNSIFLPLFLPLGGSQHEGKNKGKLTCY